MNRILQLTLLGNLLGYSQVLQYPIRVVLGRSLSMLLPRVGLITQDFYANVKDTL